jgi:hypothetical protein
MEELRERLIRFMDNTPDGAAYAELIAEAVGGAEVGEFDYAEPNDEYRARLRDLGLDPHAEGNEDAEVPFVDPLEMFKKKRESSIRLRLPGSRSK